MRIGVIRGPSLNKFEIQYYEPLAEKHDLVCFGSTKPVYDVSEIKLPVVKLFCLGQILPFPGAIKVLYSLLGDPQKLIGLEKKLAGFEIAHTAELFSFYTHQALRAKAAGLVKKVVATVSENLPFNHEEYPRQRKLKEEARAGVDHFLAISTKSKEMLIIEGVAEEKVTVVPHGIDVEKFKPGSKDKPWLKKLGLRGNDLVVLSVGRLIWEKGFEDLLLAARRLVEDPELRGAALRFIFLGRGPDKKRLVDLRDRLGLEERVIFLDSQPYDRMPAVHNLADIFVLASLPTPGWQEQFGMVLLEAMACQKPIISTLSGGIEETVGEAGLFVPPGDFLSLAEAVKMLALDARTRDRLAKTGRQRATDFFDKKVIAGKIDAVYQELRQKLLGQR